MMFKEGSPLYSIEIERRQGEDVLYVNYLSAPFVPSIADNPAVMARTVTTLADNPSVTRIVFVQQRNYNYPSAQVALLSEIARLYNFLTKQEEILSIEKMSLYGGIQEVHEDLMYLLNLLMQDPFSCYLELRNRTKGLRSQLDSGQATNKSALINYIRLLERFFSLLENTKLLKEAEGGLSDLSFGNRELYRRIFRPDILPNFTFTRLVSQLPENVELVDQYEIGDELDPISVTILKKEGDPKYIYHLLPPEYALTEEQHMLVNLARNVLTEHRPKAEEFTDPDRTRLVFFNVARD